ncbi:hypothetical protein [Micromonospora sp. NPDC005173]|uniref:hypothetical protein n=1 Tax=Micromonospora sp. NPDC005173 TaxID=3157165 RepID=UPI0033AA7EFC
MEVVEGDPHDRAAGRLNIGGKLIGEHRLTGCIRTIDRHAGTGTVLRCGHQARNPPDDIASLD